MPTLMTVGGGGFLLYDARHLQERHILAQARPTPGRRPRALFLGTASGDSDRAQLAFLNTFTALGCEASTPIVAPHLVGEPWSRPTCSTWAAATRSG